MTQSTITPITDDQKKQYLRFVEDAAERALAEIGPDKDGLERLMSGGEFQSRIVDVVREFSGGNRFADEEVESSYVYTAGYRRNRDEPIELIIADLEVQAKKLDSLFGCGTTFNKDWVVKTHPLCPNWIEKFFAQVDWRELAKTYGEAVEFVLAKLKEERPLYNYREGTLGPEYLRQSERSVAMGQKIAEQQKGYDIPVIPAQFGLHHRGRSVRRAREVFQANEFGLGAFATSIMHLTHPGRLVWSDNLWLDCAGDEFTPEYGGSFVLAPAWSFHEGGLWFCAGDVTRCSGNCGSASAVLPE